jgi:hypothetical protein
MALGVTVGIVHVAFIAFVWLYPRMRRQDRITFSVVAIAAGTVLSAFFAWLHQHERRLGAYLVVNREGIDLRQGRHIGLQDFDSFEVIRRWEATALGELKTSYLVILCTSGERIEVLGSIYHREVAKLKTALDAKMRDVLDSAV